MSLGKEGERKLRGEERAQRAGWQAVGYMAGAGQGFQLKSGPEGSLRADHTGMGSARESLRVSEQGMVQDVRFLSLDLHINNSSNQYLLSID